MNELADLHTVISALRTGVSKIFPSCTSPGFFEGYHEALAFTTNIAQKYEGESTSPKERDIFRKLRQNFKDAEITLLKCQRMSGYIYGFFAGARLALDCYAEIRHPGKRALRKIKKQQLDSLPPHITPHIMPICVLSEFDEH